MLASQLASLTGPAQLLRWCAALPAGSLLRACSCIEQSSQAAQQPCSRTLHTSTEALAAPSRGSPKSGPPRPTAGQAAKKPAAKSLMEMMRDLEKKKAGPKAAAGKAAAAKPQAPATTPAPATPAAAAAPEPGPSSAEDVSTKKGRRRGPGTPFDEAAQLQQLVHPQFGYSVIGGVDPEGAEGLEGIQRDILGVHPRVHPTRMFIPGEVYEPQGLNPFASSERERKQRLRNMPSEAEVREYADVKNVAWLEHFLSPAGKLVPRKTTKLPAPLHKEVMRKIKLARCMALIPGEVRLEKLQLRAARRAAQEALQVGRYGLPLTPDQQLSQP